MTAFLTLPALMSAVATGPNPRPVAAGRAVVACRGRCVDPNWRPGPVWREAFEPARPWWPAQDTTGK